MEQAISSPVQPHVRRAASARRKDRPHHEAKPGGADLRWSLLDLVRTCRVRLGLRDRDVAVLRGLLSLIPASARPHERVVFASNRVLIERCDGIDERTLRRRLDHLGKQGLLARQSSPNGKRYQVRDEVSDIRLTYGIDLSPLFAIHDHLRALADQCRQEMLRCKALRSVIRDILFHHGHQLSPGLADTATRSLRRVLASDDLQATIDHLRDDLCAKGQQDASETRILTASDSQNDRHIQNSDKEDFDSEQGAAKTARPDDITVQECLRLAPNAAAFACAAPDSWDGFVTLSAQLAPAIGLHSADVETARGSMGVLGCALAVIGLVESFGRIRHPRAYLHALARRARVERFDLVRMYRSLTSGSAPRQGLVSA